MSSALALIDAIICEIKPHITELSENSVYKRMHE